MKGFLQEYGIVMVVVSVVLGMLTFGKMGYAKNIQDAILGSADHIVETGEGVTKGSDVKSSDFLNIEGKEYIVLEKQGNNQALVMTASSIGNKMFFNNGVPNAGQNFGPNWNTYEGNNIDKYLENTWYKGLSAKMQNAIQMTNIKQLCYYTKNIDSPPRDNYNGEIYNTISRHVFLPSVSEIWKVVNLKNPDKVQVFLSDNKSIWLRDSEHTYTDEVTFLNHYSGKLTYLYATNPNGMRPAFVIDLSQVNYKVVGHTDYK